MNAARALGRLEHLTFKGNVASTRYGWLRLTPAYSVHLVAGLLEQHSAPAAVVLDPFCGTGTTALVCAERGIACDTTDINPFLVWLARAKTARYSSRTVKLFLDEAKSVTASILQRDAPARFTPPLHQIDKWWSKSTLSALGRAMGTIRQQNGRGPKPARDLLAIAFSRTMIERANVSFGHQSMSFKKMRGAGGSRHVRAREIQAVAESWQRAVTSIAAAARSAIRAVPSAILCDARELHERLASSRYRCVITSPPYPNRMSYIRELRPYMYWLEYLKDGRSAGELDWQAIGGTWGCATSNVAKWTPDAPRPIPYDGFERIVTKISNHSPLLSRYVTKYFHDMVAHADSLFSVVAQGGSIHYIVGNSKFYDVLLPVEQIFAALFEAAGFSDVRVETIRKRTSKKELFEFVVSARKIGR